jgi:hypothetical protein
MRFTAVGVGHPVQAVSDVRSTDARSREYERRAGVVAVFQVSLYKVEPSEAVLSFNLLTKDRSRAALLDEMVERGPEVPLVSKPSSFACLGERLARTGASPNRSVVAPSGSPKGVAPNADAGEEVALRETAQVAWEDILDASLVNDSMGDVSGINEVSEPLSCIGVDLVVVGGHRFKLFKSCSASFQAKYARPGTKTQKTPKPMKLTRICQALTASSPS